MRTLLFLVCCVAAVTGGVAARAAADGGPSPGAVLGWDGVTSRDGHARYVTMAARGITVLAVVRVRGGRVARWTSLPGSYGIPMVAYDGATAGLAARAPMLVLAPAGPSFRRVSRFPVVDTRRLRVRQTVELPGTFSFDAVSPSGRLLYLVEHVSRRDATRYRVRAYDLAARRLLARAVADKRTRGTTMRGYPLARATSRDGRWAYTLYGGGAYAFVHALDTSRAQAVCVGLPWRGNADLSRLRLSVSAAGDRLLVTKQRARGTAATIDLKAFRVVGASRL